MILPVPKTLAGRVVLMLVAGLTVSPLVSLVFFTSEHTVHALSSLGLMMAGGIVFSVLVARWTTGPLSHFAEAADRLAISHDLRTPITLLRLRAEFMTDEEERRKVMATLDDMEAMIASTLAFARDDAAIEERRAVDLAALLATSEKELRVVVEDDIHAHGGRIGLANRPEGGLTVTVEIPR